MSSVSFDSMIDDCFSPFELIEMDIKGKLFTLINKKIKENNWNQKQAAKALSISQPRVSNLKNLYHDKFSIESLLKIADSLDCNIQVDTQNSLKIEVSE